MNNGQEIDSNQQSLKKLVFGICENIYIKKEKIQSTVGTVSGAPRKRPRPFSLY